MNALATQIPWCWIIPIIVGVICAFLGYLLGRLFKSDNSGDKRELDELTSKLKSCESQKNFLKSELEAQKTKSFELEKGLSSKNNNITKVSVKEKSFDSALAKTVFGKKIKHNDLKIIEGIGPKIEGLFHQFNIKTWKDLSETSIEKCQEVLNSGGDRYRIHKPGTWPKQAKLAYDGKWKELLEWQDKLDGGKI
ncbi:hypothetical protein [Tenacibaculum sp. C7A-26P2]|uniref:hypothetical protein n=1 Tax=Tenacibaculum sp. C7A-26P2 TaxID=3447504 RepID=UPI003F85889B